MEMVSEAERVGTQPRANERLIDILDKVERGERNRIRTTSPSSGSTEPDTKPEWSPPKKRQTV
jgi:hypothetical protein